MSHRDMWTTRVRLTSFLLGFLLVFALGVKTAVASDVLVTTQLRPGLNLAGWTGEETAVEAVFAEVPALVAVYSWLPEEQRFTVAFRNGVDIRGDLTTLTPGMGLLLRLGGNQPVEWTRPHIPESLTVSLLPGWNLVTWSGLNDTPVAQVMTTLGSTPASTWLWDAETRTTMANTRASERALMRGEAVWLKASEAFTWRQVEDTLQVKFLADFTEDQQASAIARIQGAVDFFVHRFEVGVPRGLSVELDGYRSDGCHYRPGDRTIYLGGALGPGGGCLGAITHEYTHAIQYYLASRDDSGSWSYPPRGAGPTWLLEGMASYVDALHQDQQGDEAFGDFVERGMVAAGSYPLLLHEQPTHYSVASLAVLQLVERAGESSLLNFYRALRAEDSWEEAFQSALGVAVEDFYREFEESRKPLVAKQLPRQIRGTVLGPSGEPVSNIFVVVVYPEGSSISGAFLNARDDGTFSRVVEDAGAYRVWVGRKGSSCAIGWYGEPHGFTTKADEAADLHLPAEGGVDIVLQLTRPVTEFCRTISGVMLDPSGEPAAGSGDVFGNEQGGRTWGLLVTAISSDQRYHDHLAVPDTSGVFEIVVPPTRTYTLQVSSPFVRECVVAGTTGSAIPTFTADEGNIADVHLILVSGPRQPSQQYVTCGPEG